MESQIDPEAAPEPEVSLPTWLTPASGLLLLGGLLVEWSDGPVALQVPLFGGALVLGGLTFVPDAIATLAGRRLSIGVLMTVAMIGALLLGEVAEAASLAFLFSISEWLEGYSMRRAQRGLRALLALVPARVSVLRAGVESIVEPGDLALGDRLLLRPGERLATDGVIRHGTSALDLSAITGESISVEVGPGGAVLAGAINGPGALEIEVTARTSDSSLARVVRIVEQAQERKGRSQRLADRIARPLVPGVLVLAVAIAVLGSLLGDPEVWVSRALVVLVAAAPCAFALSVPVTAVSAIGAASRMGAVVKGGAALEGLALVRFVALDKTGTLTRNLPRVVDIRPASGVTELRLLEVASSLELRSEHPLAAAITAAAPHAASATDVAAVPGAGVVGTVDGAHARLGRPGFVDAGPLLSEVERMEAAGVSVVLVEHAGELLGAIGVRDELRPEAPEAVARLSALGLELAVLSGDNARTAAAIGALAGIATVHGGLAPEQKAAFIASSRATGVTAMVGDGINDAPALASADVGIAMGAMGSDVAIETADVALMGDDLRHLPALIGHARRARRIMLQNLVMSGAIIAILVPLAAAGVLGLAAVVVMHEVAEVIVIANGVRAARLPKAAGTTAGRVARWN
jgi:cation-transporting ATPase G